MVKERGRETAWNPPPRRLHSRTSGAGAPGDELPIGAYGLIADGYTAALIGADGGVGFLCVPRFDSPSIFAALLDRYRGGVCRLAPVRGGLGRQRYLRHTNVLVTEFDDGVRITDWMPARYEPGAPAGGALCRCVEARRGAADIVFTCLPRPGYGRHAARWRSSKRGWRAAGDPALWLAGPGPVAPHQRFHLRAGEAAWLTLGWGEPGEAAWAAASDPVQMRASLAATVRFWRDWAVQAQYAGPHREAVLRSALTLKALVYAPTGAMVAAPTTSLPEAIGGSRNWDYRYCWPRDAAFALYGLSLLGYHDEGGRFLEFVAGLSERHPLPLQVCYRVDGSADLPERSLDWLAGYRGSRPVRIGNAAVHQSQLDINGEILDAAYTCAKWRGGIAPPLWRALRGLADYAAAHWREPDQSLWEVRGGPRQFTFSKVMCWVALDRALKLARLYRLPGARARWRRAAAALRREVFAHGYNRRLHAFTQSFGGESLDASLLLLPLVRFVNPRDPRMQATVRRVRERLAPHTLVARYENTAADGVGGPEGAFAICTFWLVDCLTLTGDAPAARRLFERMLRHSSRLGLFSEEIDPQTGALLGNYPQAFTHTALINSAHNLERYPRGVPPLR